MKFSLKHVVSALVVAVVCLAISPQASNAAVPQQSTAKTADGLVFKWKKAPWPDVVEWFADQAGFILEPVDQYPDGTFSLESDRALTSVEAIDEINHRLRLSDPPKMLLRNGRRLFLVDVGTELPAELVETIEVSELENRGKYEPLQVVFDVSGLNLEEIERQVRQRVQSHNEKFFQVYSDTSEFFVRESGANLRFMRNIIMRAKASGTSIYSVLTLKHISAELFLQQLSAFHDLDENYRNSDGTLTLVIDPTAGSQRIMIRGTPEKIRDVENAAAVIDVEPGKVEKSADDPTTLRQYLVPQDSKEAFEVIDRLLFDEGNGARLSLGSETGNITVMGKASDHAIVEEYLGLQVTGGGFATIQLVNGKAGDILMAAQTILGITSENVATKVNMLANTDRDFIMLRGTPPQVSEAKLIIEELDRKSAPVSDGLRTPRRVIQMPKSDIDRIMPTLEDVWPTFGRENPFIVRPPRRAKDDDSLFRRNENRSTIDREQGSAVKVRLFEYAAMAFPATALRLTTTMIQEADEPSPGDVKEESEGYKMPEQVESVPGAPVRVWATEFGIIVESEDLDAADDVEYMIDQLLGEESEETKPTIYQLAHCEASYMKSLLESMYGIESGGGGGGGGLLSGIAGNVLGEAGGGIADSLFGGGLGGGDSAAATLEGDVSIGIDGRLNYLWVTGATANDLVLIDAAVDLFDVSTPEHNPETAGQIYTIPIKHRDPEDMKTTVESLMSKYFSDPEAKQGGGGNDAANMMKMMRQMAGGGKGGGGSDAEEVKARGYLSVDAQTSQLLFMGPKFIFIQVEVLVAALDQPEIAVPRVMVQIDLEGNDGAQTAKMLKNILGSNIEILGADMETAEGGADGASKEAAGGANAKKGASSAQAAQQKQAEAARANFIQMMQQRARAQGGQQGGGRGGRAGGGGGGGGRGGGGRGGR